MGCGKTYLFEKGLQGGQPLHGASFLAIIDSKFLASVLAERLQCACYSDLRGTITSEQYSRLVIVFDSLHRLSEVICRARI